MPSRTRHRKPQRGLSLIELMVGLTIGVIAVLIMAQMAIFYDRQKRSNAGGADAQNTGAIALYSIESDVMQAGYGMDSLHTLNCLFQTSRSFDGRRLMPVMVIPDGMARTNVNNVLGIPPGDAGSDIVVVMFSNTDSTAEGVPISGSTNLSYSFSRNVTGFNVGDFILAAQTNQPCTVAQVTGVANPTITVDHSNAGATYANGIARIYNVGTAGITMRAYAVRNGSLTVCDFWTSNCAADLGGLSAAQVSALWVPVASNVVALRAQYGWDTSATVDKIVDTYCRSRLSTALTACPANDDGMTAPATVPNTSCDWTRIAALRVAIVTRSVERAPESAQPSPASIQLWPTVTAGAATGINALPATAGPVFAVPDRWYRYKVFNTAVTIRNMNWSSVEASCL